MSGQQPTPAWVDQVRQHRIQGLQQLEKQLDKYRQHIKLEDADLVHFGITTTEMDPITMVNSVPALFFRPFQNNLPSPDDDKVGKPFPLYGSDNRSRGTFDCINVIKRYISSYNFLCTNDAFEQLKASKSKKAAEKWRRNSWEMLFVEDMDIPYVIQEINPVDWFANLANQLPDPQYPQLLVFMDIKFDGDDKLLLAELLAIVRMMVTRLASERGEGHTIAPVQLFSYMGRQHTRVIQAHYDERGLHINHSKLYDFTFKNCEGLDAMARFSLCTAVGNTITDRQY
ncbi:hypothetical protein B7463_g3480, partial [Scytalidium lignicola]